jgi:hypothetical protein
MTNPVWMLIIWHLGVPGHQSLGPFPKSTCLYLAYVMQGQLLMRDEVDDMPDLRAGCVLWEG